MLENQLMFALSLTAAGQQILGFMLIGGAVLVALYAAVKYGLPKLKDSNLGKKVTDVTNDIIEKTERPKVVDNTNNTDKPAPAGFAEHFQLIIDTSPTADPKYRQEYALKAMTEAEVLLAERERLEKLVGARKNLPKEDDKEEKGS